MISRFLGWFFLKFSPPCPYRTHGCHRTLYEGMRGRCWASDCPVRPVDRKRMAERPPRNYRSPKLGYVDCEYLEKEYKE